MKIEARRLAGRCSNGAERVEIQRCRFCRCTERRACITAAGPCAWLEPDVCTGCADKAGWLRCERVEKWGQIFYDPGQGGMFAAHLFTPGGPNLRLAATGERFYRPYADAPSRADPA